jgi:hypothetical protein
MKMTEDQLIQHFDEAIENGFIHLLYQPQFNHSTKRMIGAEALMRWKDPEFGMQYPSDFIPVLERCGLICFEDGVPLLVAGDRADLEQSFPVYARQARDVDDVPEHGIEKANVFVGGDMARTLEVVDHLRERFCALGLNVPMAGFVNTTPLGWSKASGIDVLCEELSITLDQVVVFGDGGNDVEMLAHVPHSAAVADAVPEARAAATYVIGSCEDESVATCLEALARGAWPFG